MPLGDHLHQALSAHRALGERIETGLDGHHRDDQQDQPDAPASLLGRRKERLEATAET